MTEEQKEWKESKAFEIKAKPYKKSLKPNQTWRIPLYKLSISSKFDSFILIIITLNTLSMAVHWYNAPKLLDVILEYLNYLFGFIYTFEALVKIIGLGKQYF